MAGFVYWLPKADLSSQRLAAEPERRKAQTENLRVE